MEFIQHDAPLSGRIKDINLNIAGNTMTAFVGHSGAGKSTIMNLLPRFYEPQEGIIKIDNQDIKSISLKSLRKFSGIDLKR